MLEKPLMLDMQTAALARFGDGEDDYNLPTRQPDVGPAFETWARMTAATGARRGALAARAHGKPPCSERAPCSVGAVRRKRVRSVDRHAGSRALDTLDGLGKWLRRRAWRAVTRRALRAGQRFGNTGIAAIQAGATACSRTWGSSTRWAAQARGREGARGFRAVQALELFFPLEPRDRHLGGVTPSQKSTTRRGCMEWPRSPTPEGSPRASTGCPIRWRARCSVRDRRFLLAGAPQARRQGAKVAVGPGGVSLMWETN